MEGAGRGHKLAVLECVWWGKGKEELAVRYANAAFEPLSVQAALQAVLCFAYHIQLATTYVTTAPPPPLLLLTSLAMSGCCSCCRVVLTPSPVGLLSPGDAPMLLPV
jgi:hypothetical protein